MKRPSKNSDQYSPKEAEERMAAALRGARIAGHKPMSKVSPKRNVAKKAQAKQKEPGK